jgi:hypothetical protein
VSHSRIEKQLSPLGEALPDFKGFLPGRAKSDQIREYLIGLARARRARTPMPFYSMADTASFFGVAVSTVAEIYRRLAGEGWLVIRRGAMTVVPPRQLRPRAHIRGIVAVPIWAPGFLWHHDWRVFIKRFEDAARRGDWVTDLTAIPPACRRLYGYPDGGLGRPGRAHRRGFRRRARRCPRSPARDLRSAMAPAHSCRRSRRSLWQRITILFAPRRARRARYCPPYRRPGSTLPGIGTRVRIRAGCLHICDQP